ncbi:MAG TPA: thioredoxin domain-containing protein [Spirochaetota bacterium]|nr:thioredoxin domain-containing protein [Spirochaetota bacterium]HPG50910.1 thioredoxin domain-containing protein [Spirochaetota bacterium]
MKKENRLGGEKSPYLLQHRHNPVDWYPWGEEAFARARAKDLPVFLSIGYSTCHWCHVMERESFENEEAARALNESFVSIKVDREERPDIDRVYMTVCQMMTGSGGWPLTIIMTPDKKPFFSATYIPRESAGGRMGLVDLLGRVAGIWKERRADIEGSAASIAAALSRQAPEAGEEEPGRAEAEAACAMFASVYDRVHGGFGGAPKFPSPHNLIFLLRHGHYTGDTGATGMALETLRRMRAGGIFDQVGFGFHRYSTDERWLVPHFEKMLYDQAMMAAAYLEAYHASGEPWCEAAAREIFEYVLRDMTAPEGAFYSAEDADSAGSEGAFYLWTDAELEEALGPEDAAFARRAYAFREGGNYVDEAAGSRTGGNIPHLAGPPADPHRLESVRGRLFAARGLRPRPFRDDKVLADWNGLMIAALAAGARITGEDRYRAAADRAADFIVRNMAGADGSLLHRYREGDASIAGNLDDYAFLTWGLVELYAAGFDEGRLGQALRIAAAMLRLFSDTGGGLYFSPSDGEELLARSAEYHDGAYPSGNSIAYCALVRLSRLTGDPAWESAARGILRGAAAGLRRHPAGYGMLLAGMLAATAGSREVVLAGDPGSPAFRGMLDRVRRAYMPDCSVLVKRPGSGGEALSAAAPFTGDMKVPEEGAAAYVCTGGSCRQPVHSAGELERLLSRKST